MTGREARFREQGERNGGQVPRVTQAGKPRYSDQHRGNACAPPILGQRHQRAQGQNGGESNGIRAPRGSFIRTACAALTARIVVKLAFANNRVENQFVYCEGSVQYCKDLRNSSVATHVIVRLRTE